MKKYNCDGQMSLFDFLDQPVKPKPKAKVKVKAPECCSSCKYWLGECRAEKKPVTKNSCNITGLECKAHTNKGCSMPDKCELLKEVVDNNNICEHSGHTCNKEELWKVAIEIDTQCPKKCCRLCDIKDCGARCNGAPKEPPRLLKEGQIVYQILRCEIIPYKVSGNSWTYEHQTGRERGYDLLTLDEHPSHSVCSNSNIGNTVYTTLEAAQNRQMKMIEKFGDDLLPVEKMNIEKVVAYSYTHKDFYSNGEDKLVTNFYAILDNGLIYLHTGSKYEHCYQDIKKGIKEFEEDKANLIKFEKELTEIEDYVPTLQNMYKSGHDSWDYSEARYSYMGG